MLIGRPGRRPLRPLHNHHFFIHSLTVKKLLPLIRQRTTRCTHSRSDKTHKSNPFLKIHSYLQFYDIPKPSSLSFLIVTSLLHEFYQKSTYFYTILQLPYSHHTHNPSTSTQSVCAGIKGYSPITSAILGTSAIQADSAAPQPSPQSNTNSAIAVVQRSADDPQPTVKRHYFSPEAPAGEGDAGWLCFCRRGADSWTAGICVVFQKSAV